MDLSLIAPVPAAPAMSQTVEKTIRSMIADAEQRAAAAHAARQEPAAQAPRSEPVLIPKPVGQRVALERPEGMCAAVLFTVVTNSNINLLREPRSRSVGLL